MRTHAEIKKEQAEMECKMNKLVRGALVAAITTGVVMSNKEPVVAKAQTVPETVRNVAEFQIEPNHIGGILLIPNQVVRANQSEYIAQKEKKKKEAIRKAKEEAIRKEKLRKEKERQRQLAILRKKREEKRAKEIKACCGVMVHTKAQTILERIVEAEAGGEPFKGRVLVANVVLNRVKHHAFPSTVEGVVFAHRGSRYQFSPISDGRYYQVTVSDTTKKAVLAALNGVDPSQGALYFMERSIAESSNVSWFDRCLTRLFRYGCHEFYK